MTTALTLPSVLADLGFAEPEVEHRLPGGLDDWIANQADDLVGVRRHLHAHPEVSGQEFETTAYLAAAMSDLGLKPYVLPAGTGLYCDIDGDRGAALVGLRADIDALPMHDPKDVPYRSTVDGATHACGHDLHTAVLIGAARALVRLAESGQLAGRVRVIFQPAEETASGAAKVLDAGGMDGVTSVYALHCAPRIPVGFAAIKTGPMTAAADLVRVRLSGPGGHTSRPQLTADLVHALGRVIVDVPAMMNRRIDPLASASLVWGATRAGTAPNAIPTEAELSGFVRVLDRDAWRGMGPLVTQLIKDAVAGSGAEVDVDYVVGVPPVVNDAAATAVLAAAASAVVGAERVLEAEPSMGGEDFSQFADRAPGAMLRLGVGVPDAPIALDLHRADFDVDERAIPLGARLMVHTALGALRALPQP